MYLGIFKLGHCTEIVEHLRVTIKDPRGCYHTEGLEEKETKIGTSIDKM